MIRSITQKKPQKEIERLLKGLNRIFIIGCGTCVASCPMDVIRLDKKIKKSKIVYAKDCQICHLCRMYCPVDAITISPEKSIPVIVSWG